MNRTIKHIAPWLAAAAVGGTLFLAPVASAATQTALIANAPVAAADNTGPSPATSDNTDTSSAVASDNDNTVTPGCFPANDVRTAQQAGDVQSACG